MSGPVGFTDLNTILGNDRNRIGQQDLAPAAIQNRFLSSSVIQNSATTTSIGTVTNGNSIVVQSIITSTANDSVPLGSVPYCIAFFQGSASTANLIGASITGSGYSIKGPLAMPVFTPNASSTGGTTYGGSTGANLVYITELFNNTGSTQTIYILINSRFIQGSGGVAK